MNPDQPSREQIEARLTALLLGELPAAEAELLRWTISQDPELQKLHDQLKVTIGFVREAMKNPTGAPVDREAPLKLAQERRQTLLAHFKTARPQPPEKLFWLNRIKIPSARSLAIAAIIIFVICGLAAITIPNFVKARSTSQANSIINNLRQIDAAKNQWALDQKKSPDAVPTANDLTPYLQGGAMRSVAGENYVLGKVSEPTVADINSKRMTATPDTFLSFGTELSATHSIREPRPMAEYRLETGKASGSAGSASVNPQEPKVPPQPAPIALPNTESSQTESERNGSAVYSQGVVGYVNVKPGAPYTLSSAPTQIEPQTGLPETTPKSVPGFDFGGGRSTSRQPAGQSGGGILAMMSPPPASSTPPQLAGQEIRAFAERAYTGTTISGRATTISTVPQQPVNGLLDDTNAVAANNSFGMESSISPGVAGSERTVIVEHAFAKPMSTTNYLANGIAMDWPQLRPYGIIDGDRNIGRLATRESQNANSVAENSDQMQPSSLSDTERVTNGSFDSDIKTLKTKYQAEEAQIQLDRSKVDQLRRQYNIHDTGNSTTPTPTVNSEQMQHLNEKLIEQKAQVIKEQKEFAEFKSIQDTNPTKLADVLTAVSPDTTLSDLLGKLHENEQKLAVDSANLGASNPDVTFTKASVEALKKEISNRVNGIMLGLQGQVDAGQAQVDGLNRQLKDYEQADQDELVTGQPYWHAKERLQSEEDLHNLIAQKIKVDESESAMPKNAMVTIVNPAQPGQSQNLWQRLTGTVESQARIEIQPDITSDAPISYAPYDPYFIQTEVNSIQSDAVLGKVIDALKLDQAWSTQDDGEKLSRKDTIAMLRSHLDLQTIQNTKLINIGAKSDKPEEAAKIANAVAEAYKQYRLETHSNEMVAGIRLLQQRYAKEDKQIRQKQTELQQMQKPVSAGQADQPLLRPPANAPIPQPEILTSDNAFSTFSMNVSDVSFKLAMASLEKGRMPDPGSIRSEEFINAFDYHDPEPLQGEPLAFMSDRASDPFAHERDLLRFSIKAAAAGRQDGRALNLVLLLDTSGSMERADRVAIIREALRVLSAQLQPHDVVSVVTFARTARLWADGIPGDQAGATLDKVGNITPEGGTNLEEAMRLAYETALRHFIAGGINRVVLLTDGAANLGNVEPQTLTQKVNSERRQGIALDCFGIGWDDYNDDLLEQLSSNGDGRYAFINSPDEAATEFAAKLAGALQVAAEDVKVQVEFNPNRVTVWRQIGYAKHQLTKEQFRDNSVAAGAIAAREAGNALYVIQAKPDGEGPIATVRVRYRVPGTQDIRERSWFVDYTGPAPELAQSSPAMRLAASAAEISEWMADSPFAQEVTPDELLNYLSGVPQLYGTDKRPQQLEWLIREAKSVSGK